jgi:hypothetical protein
VSAFLWIAHRASTRHAAAYLNETMHQSGRAVVGCV